MHKSSLLLSLVALASAQSSEFTSQSPPRSTKRGLVAISDIADPKAFYAPLLTSQSDISWYYNYGPNPTDALSGFSTGNGSALEFVPMLWGATASNPGNGFADGVQSLMRSGHNISHVLSFNEPDGCDNGGSCVTPQLAAQVWQKQLAPLQQQSGSGAVRVSAPAVTGSQRGLDWLANFFAACGGACKPDFLAVHYYGDFGGLAGFLGQLNASYAGNVSSLWVTEFALANADLHSTQAFYNSSTAYFDRLPFVERYAYFGSFRSSRSALGINAAMFDGYGAPTSLGLWYAGLDGTGAPPTATGNGTDGSKKSDAVGSRALVRAEAAYLAAALLGSAFVFL